MEKGEYTDGKIHDLRKCRIDEEIGRIREMGIIERDGQLVYASSGQPMSKEDAKFIFLTYLRKTLDESIFT